MFQLTVRVDTKFISTFFCYLIVCVFTFILCQDQDIVSFLTIFHDLYAIFHFLDSATS